MPRCPRGRIHDSVRRRTAWRAPPRTRCAWYWASVDREERRRLLRKAWTRFRGGDLSPHRAAASVALGLAIGVTPLWGTHWMLVLLLAVPLRLDAGLAFLASNVSLPFVAPFITFAEVELGARLLRGAWLPLDPRALRALDLMPLLGELVLGTALVAAGLSSFGAALAFALVSLLRGARRGGTP